MAHESRFVVLSLELHLFFARIMKEHALFLKAGFTPVNSSFAKEAQAFMQKFEDLLCRVVDLSNGIVSQKVLCSGEILTEFTQQAECQTQAFTGICINKEITARQACLEHGQINRVSQQLYRQVKLLNHHAIQLLDGLIQLKERLLDNILNCNMFTMNYPLLLEHILKEAKLYRSYVWNLETKAGFDYQGMRQVEQFWNQIMMEHALFIRGLLDPSETQLIETSNAFANDYARLLANCQETYSQTMPCGPNPSLEETVKFRDFKLAGTKGIEECKIRSIILPLLADHVLREANHYIRLLAD